VIVAQINQSGAGLLANLHGPVVQGNFPSRMMVMNVSNRNRLALLIVTARS